MKHAVLVWLSMTTALLCGGAGTERNVRRDRPSSQRWALLIGIDDYHEAADLQFCVKDVLGLRDCLVAAGFARENVVVLHDNAPAKYLPFKSNIERQLELVLKLAGDDDMVVVAFSGHGVHLGGTSYICPVDTRLEDSRTLISLEQVFERMRRCPAALRLLLVDACRNDPRPRGQKSPKATDSTRQFAGSLEKPPKGILVLSSCAPGQVSVEDDSLGHGVFMNFLQQGMTGPADKSEGNADGRVSLLELYRYAHLNTKRHVARTRNTLQTPMLRGEIAGDFEIGRAPVKARPSSVSPQPAATPVKRPPTYQELMEGAFRRELDKAKRVGKSSVFDLKDVEELRTVHDELATGSSRLRIGIRNGRPVILAASQPVLESLRDEVESYSLQEAIDDFAGRQLTLKDLLKSVNGTEATLQSIKLGAGGKWAEAHPNDYQKVLIATLERATSSPELIRRLEPGGADESFVTDQEFLEILCYLVLDRRRHDILKSLSANWRATHAQEYQQLAEKAKLE